MSRSMALVRFASLAFALAVAACESSSTAPVTAPPPDLSMGGVAQEIAAPGHSGGKVSGYIGRLGGRLHFDDHSAWGVEYWLDVPAGAVGGNTLFQMDVKPGNNYRVVLHATAGSTDVGAQGFAQPVRLTISYSTAHVWYASHLYVASVPDHGGALVPVKTVTDPDQKTVTGYLPHFSKWTIIAL